MKKSYILGAGPSGLIAAYYLPHFDIIGLKHEESLFSLGPRLLQKTDNMLKLVKEVIGKKYPINIEKARIGYKMGGKIYDKIPENFKEEYVKLTRKTDACEESHLSGNKSIIEHITLDKFGNKSYDVFFNELFNIIQPQFIESKITNIDNDKITCYLHFFNTYIKDYDKIINTISLKHFCKLNKEVNSIIVEKYFDTIDFTTISKNFYKCEYKDIIKIIRSKNIEMYSYIYSIDGDYTRKTFFHGHIVYETTNIIEDRRIEDNIILERKENLSVQIKSSLNIEHLNNIYFLGRYAQWNHKMKVNEVVDRVLKIKKEIYG